MQNTQYVTQIRNVLDHYRDNPGKEAVEEIKYNGWANVLKLEKCFYCYCESQKQKKSNFVNYFTVTCKSNIRTLYENINKYIKKKQKQENIKEDLVKGLMASLILATEINNKYKSEYKNQIDNFHPENFDDANGIDSLKADAGKRVGNESAIYKRALGLILKIANKNKNLTYRQTDPHVLGALIEVGAVNVSASDKENLKTEINPKWYETAKPILEKMPDIQLLITATSANNEYYEQITNDQIKVWLDVNKKLGVNKETIGSIENMLQMGVNNGTILGYITNHWMYFPRLRRWVGNYLKEHLTNLDGQTFVKELLTCVTKIIKS